MCDVTRPRCPPSRDAVDRHLGHADFVTPVHLYGAHDVVPRASPAWSSAIDLTSPITPWAAAAWGTMIPDPAQRSRRHDRYERAGGHDEIGHRVASDEVRRGQGAIDGARPVLGSNVADSSRDSRPCHDDHRRKGSDGSPDGVPRCSAPAPAPAPATVRRHSPRGGPPPAVSDRRSQPRACPSRRERDALFIPSYGVVRRGCTKTRYRSS